MGTIRAPLGIGQVQLLEIIVKCKKYAKTIEDTLESISQDSFPSTKWTLLKFWMCSCNKKHRLLKFNLLNLIPTRDCLTYFR